MAVEIAPRIVVDPAVRFGKPVIRGTRVPVTTVVGTPAGGLSAEEVAAAYGLTLDEVQAALSYAAKLVAEAPPLVGESRR